MAYRMNSVDPYGNRGGYGSAGWPNYGYSSPYGDPWRPYAPYEEYPDFKRYPDSSPPQPIVLGDGQQGKQGGSQNMQQMYDMYKKFSGGGAGIPMEQNAAANFGTDKAVDLSTAYGGGEKGLGTESSWWDGL